MTTPNFERDSGSRGTQFMDWIRLNTKWVTIAGVVVLVGLVVSWAYTKHQRDTAERAAKEFMSARMSISLGGENQALARSDLQRISSRYKGTAAAIESGVLLALLDYQTKDFNSGIKVLEGVLSDAPAAMRPSLQGLIGDGHAELGKHGEAATWYERGAQETVLIGEREQLKARAARAYADAGDKSKATAIWTELAASQDNPATVAEARVRLNELTAKPGG